MSILNRMTSQHLDDGTFAEIWTNASLDGGRASHPHLDACAECRVRYAGFVGWLDAMKAEAADEAADAFPADRLLAQQSQILRRLETLDRPTRVIAFPGATPVTTRPFPVRRWITAAAAAGLVAGIGLGQLMDLRHGFSGPSVFPADRLASDVARPAATPAAPQAVSASLSADDIALAELEEAATPQYEALRAYDAFTPRAADLIAASNVR